MGPTTDGAESPAATGHTGEDVIGAPTTSSNAVPVLFSSHSHAIGSVANVAVMQTPMDGSCTNASKDAKPALLVGKQLLDDAVATAMHATGELVADDSSSVNAAVVATASL